MLLGPFLKLMGIGKRSGIGAESSDLDRRWGLRKGFHSLIYMLDKLDLAQLSASIATTIKTIQRDDT
jgi:hypothetical protein